MRLFLTEWSSSICLWWGYMASLDSTVVYFLFSPPSSVLPYHRLKTTSSLTGGIHNIQKGIPHFLWSPKTQIILLKTLFLLMFFFFWWVGWFNSGWLRTDYVAETGLDPWFSSLQTVSSVIQGEPLSAAPTLVMANRVLSQNLQWTKPSALWIPD